MSSAHLDTFCDLEWVYRKRSMCTSQENVVALLGGGNGQHTYFSERKQIMWMPRIKPLKRNRSCGFDILQPSVH